MPTFSFRAVSQTGELHEDLMEASSESAVVERLQDQGLVPLTIESATAAGRRVARGRRKRGKGFGRKQLIAVTRELAALLRAGLPLDRALEILIQLAENEDVESLLVRVRDSVRGGSNLSDALEEQEVVFGRFYLNMVRAGEAGGSTEVALSRLADYLERASALRETVVSALIYPAILFAVAVLSVLILLTFVVPQFAQLFDDMGRALPLPTRIVMAAGDVIAGYWWLMLGGTLLVIYLVRRLLQDPGRRKTLDRWMLHWPLLGELIAKLETARFSHTFGTLLQSGVPVLNALGIVRGTLSNTLMADSVADAADALKQGDRLGDALMRDGVFPAFAVHMIKVGEETGRMEEMLGQIAEIYDEEVRATVKRLLALVEPVLILGLGVLIAAIIMSILVAILAVNELAF